MNKWMKKNNNTWTNEKYPCVIIEYSRNFRIFMVYKGKDSRSYKEFRGDEFHKAKKYAESMKFTSDIQKDFGKLPDKRLFYNLYE